jgi:hypothetical protein
VASNTSGRFAYAHLNDTVRQGGHGSDGFDTLRYDVVRSAKVWRSRLGSFRKDSIWRSWVRSGGQVGVGLGSVWSGGAGYVSVRWVATRRFRFDPFGLG